MNPGISRRELLKNSGRAAAVSALASVAIPHVHAAEDSTIQLALVGCGGRGTGAAADALSSKVAPTKLVAIADVFQERLDRTPDNLKKALKLEGNGQVDVPKERQFLGFDGYKQAMDCLRPGDVVIMATPPAFRWVQFRYAIDKGLNVFMEKPLTVDGPSTRKLLALGEESVKNNLKVGVGLMCRHCEARQALHDRIKAGEIGDIVLLRTYRQHAPLASSNVGPKPEGMNELLFQVKNFHGFLWASGGCYSDFLIHSIDECCWMKDAWPVEAKASGGRQFRGDEIDQNFDHYAVEYTFGDGTKMLLEGRTIAGCSKEFASYAHGTKGSAVISTSSHTPAKCRIYKGQNVRKKEDLVWAFPPNEKSPYQLEWNHLLDAIVHNKPYNEVKRGAEASLVTAMGRMAAHTGQIITFDQMLNCSHEFAPEVSELSFDSPAPLQVAANGKYPVPQPGIIKDREF